MLEFSRREIVAGLGGVGSLIASEAIGPDGLFEWTTTVETSAPAGTWQEIDRDPRRSGYAPSEGPGADATEQWSVEFDLYTEWLYDRGISAPYHHRPGIVVDEQHVYALERDALVAFERQTGRRAWEFEPPAVMPPFNTETDYDQTGFAFWRGWSACRDGTVLVNGGSRGDRDKWPIDVLYAVDATDGSLNWALPEHVGYAVLGDAVLCSGSRGSSLVDIERSLVDIETGRSRAVPLPQTGGILACFVTDDAHTFSFGGLTKKGIKTVRSSVFDSDLVVSQADMFGTTITTDGITLLGNPLRLNLDVDGDPSAIAVDLLDGTHWPVTNEIGLSPETFVTDDEQWYILTDESVKARPVNETAARENSRTPTWETAVPKRVGRPVVTDDAVYATTKEGIVVLDSESGDRRGRIGPEPVTEPSWGWLWSPVIVNDTLYCRLGDGKLHAYA